jgi:signal transduction histidine kinase
MRGTAISLRTKIVLFNGFVLALVLLATAVAGAGFRRAFVPLQQAVAEEARSADLVEALRGELGQDQDVTAAGAALDRFLVAQENAAREAERSSARAALVTTAVYVACLAAAGAAGAAVSLRFSRHLLDRVAALVGATKRLAAGDRAVRLDAPGAGGDELDLLAREFNRTVTHLAAAEAAARRADELQASFFASVSHDLRTPLTVVAGLLETLERSAAGAPTLVATGAAAGDPARDPATRRDLIAVAAAESRRLVRLVNNLLDLSRLEAGAWPLDREPVDLAALARARVDDLSLPGGPLAAHRVEVQGEGTAEAWADAVQIGRVLDNLLTNAAKFSPPGSTVRVSVSGPPAGAPAAPETPLAVRVSDEGPGVPPESRAYIFEKFYRAGTTSAGSSTGTGSASGTGAGTGLGLAICRGIVETHGGSIWLGTGLAGDGAVFYFTLPAVAIASPEAPPPADSGALPARTAPRQTPPRQTPARLRRG